MGTITNVLIIDDHPLITDSYKKGLTIVAEQEKDLEFKVETANSCDVAFDKITHAAEHTGYDLIFLDIKLPASKSGQILSGEDLGIKIRKIMPEAKIIVATTYNDNYRLNNILKSVNPEGFMVKNDLTPDQLLDAIKTVINDPPFYSSTISKLFRKQISNDFVIDNLDRQLLYYLSQGIKTKELPKYVALSKPAIERRKRHLKDIFNVESNQDRELISIAKEKGFL